MQLQKLLSIGPPQDVQSLLSFLIPSRWARFVPAGEEASHRRAVGTHHGVEGEQVLP